MISRNSDATEKKNETMKLLYSYGGVIRPRSTDGKLRYVGGHTRVLSVDRSISFSELIVKFVELCGSSMVLKCKLPDEDLDVLVTVASDEDLRNVIAEYDRFSSKDVKKITAVLFPKESLKKISPVSSSDDLCSISSGSSGTSVSSPSSRFAARRSSPTSSCRSCGRISPALRLQIDAAGRFRSNPEQGKPPRPLNRQVNRVASADDLCSISSGSSSGLSPSYAHQKMTSSSSHSRLSTLGNQNDGVGGRNAAIACRGEGNPRPVASARTNFSRCH